MRTKQATLVFRNDIRHFFGTTPVFMKGHLQPFPRTYVYVLTAYFIGDGLTRLQGAYFIQGYFGIPVFQ